MKATVAHRSDSQPANTEHSPAGGEVLLRPRPARRRRPARDVAGRAPRPSLRLVATDGRVVRPAPGEPVRTNPGALDTPPVPPAPPQQQAAPHQAAARPAAPAAARRAAPGLAPLRLTRRGRLVVTAMAVLLVAAGSVALASAAQAMGHSGATPRPGTAGAAITRVEVRPGQSLWTLAETYDPNADTRQVIQEILQLNSMSTDQVRPGQVLWMPRD
ncbi:MAG TPA: LysM peptidoglycan-binding domain-containing protein [Trebonia sp.]|nr:LysM peptidoglycan-binding domain-containing protein [Trebonia sp.]